MGYWEIELIEHVLLQLEDRDELFSGYSLCKTGKGLNLLGKGGFAYVYEMEKKRSPSKRFALKVIGFGKPIVDSEKDSDSNKFLEIVSFQEQLSYEVKTVIKVYGAKERWIELDESGCIVEVYEHKISDKIDNVIKLQFVLMEKATPIVARKISSNEYTFIEPLQNGGEREVFKLATNIGDALNQAHERKILHRDVKLDNIFYDEQHKLYKLGDFGIAKQTETGFAKTVAMTQGFGAPEVLKHEESYDKTADIYSFGKTLEKLPGPHSENYNRIIANACNINPNLRYQSMEEMFVDIENLFIGSNVGYKRKNRRTSLVLGLFLLALGIMSWIMIQLPDWQMSFKAIDYIYAALCTIQFIRNFIQVDFDKRPTRWFVLLVAGLCWTYLTGYKWWKLIMIIFVAFSNLGCVGMAAVSFLSIRVALWLQQIGVDQLSQHKEYNWIPILCFSLAFVLVFEYELLADQDRSLSKQFYRKNLFWICVCVYYLICIGYGFNGIGDITIFYELWEPVINFIYTYNLDLKSLGLAGLAFSLYYVLRENILIYKKKRAVKS